MIELKLLLLILIANGAPVLARDVLGKRLALPIDFNVAFIDERPLFGSTKTWRGIIAAMLCCGPAAWLLGFNPWLGLVVAGLAMFGDLLASFIKRRLKLAPSSRALGLDQVPESLLPMLGCQFQLDLGWHSTLIVVVLFIVLELVLSRLMYQLHIRKRPY